MKITVYTVNDCQYSKAEKEYLAAHNLPYEEKNLEANKEWLTEMLALGNNFAGTPLTKVEKDDGQIAVLKGYNKEEFDKILGLGQPQTAVVNSTITAPQADDQKPIASTPQPVAPQTTPASQPETPARNATQSVAGGPQKDEALSAVLDNLQSKAEPSITPPATPQPSPLTSPATAAAAGALPSVPEPDFK